MCPTKGGAPAVNDTLAGSVDAMFAVMPEAIPHVQAGKLHALAVMSPAALARVTQRTDDGESGFADLEPRRGSAFRPAKTPRRIIDQLNRAVQAALDAEMKAKLAENGMEVSASTPKSCSRW